MGLELYREYLGDLYDVRYTILYCSLISVVLSFVFVVLLRNCAGLMVWIIILLYFLALGVITFVCYSKYSNPALM